MASELFDNFRMNSDLPNFERDLFDTVDDMVAFSEDYLPDVFECNTKDGKRYRYNVNNDVDPILGKWRLVEGIGGTSIEDWTSGKGCVTGDLVIYDNKLYKCKVVPVDNTVFNIDEWQLIGNEGGATTAENVTYQNDNYASLTNVKLALDQLIEDVYYVNPEITSFTATPNGGVFEIGETITSPITFDWTYNKNVLTQSLTDCILTDNTDRTSTYNSDITSDKTFTLSAGDDKENVTKSISYKFVNPYYTGVLTTDTVTETNITALTKKVETKGSKTINYTTAQSHMVFAYPSSYGAIKSIIDQNGFNVTDSFVRNTLTVNSVEYYVYISNQCSGSYSIKFNY